MNYQITLNDKQVGTLIMACESYMRIAMAQIDIGLEMALDVPTDKIQEVKKHCEKIKELCTGLTHGGCYGISSKGFSEPARVIHDMYEVMRNRLAWDRKPLGGVTVDFSPPFKVSKEKMIEIENLSDTTIDGWSTVIPEENGIYAVRFPDQRNDSYNKIKIYTAKKVRMIKNIENGHKEELLKIDRPLHWIKIEDGKCKRCEREFITKKERKLFCIFCNNPTKRK